MGVSTRCAMRARLCIAVGYEDELDFSDGEFGNDFEEQKEGEQDEEVGAGEVADDLQDSGDFGGDDDFADVADEVKGKSSVSVVWYCVHSRARRS